MRGCLASSITERAEVGVINPSLLFSPIFRLLFWFVAADIWLWKPAPPACKAEGCASFRLNTLTLLLLLAFAFVAALAFVSELAKFCFKFSCFSFVSCSSCWVTTRHWTDS